MHSFSQFLWISKKGTEVLNAAGPRASEDLSIYGLVTVILELVFTLTTAKSDTPGQTDDNGKIGGLKSTAQPKTVEEAVNFLILKLSLKDKSTVARMSENDLDKLQLSIGLYIRNRLFYPGNDALLESCRQAAKDKYLHWDQAPGVIIKKLWEKLRETHKLRIVE